MHFLPEADLIVRYKGVELDFRYRPDFICFNEVIVEVKALSELTNIDRAQTINYLKATGYRRAVLLNFGVPSLQYERLIFG
jgi:GxxExxY protein